MRATVGGLAGSTLLVLILGFLLWREHHRVQILQEQIEVLRQVHASNRFAESSRSHPQPPPPSKGETTSAAAQVMDAAQPAPAYTDDERRFRAQWSEVSRWDALGKKADLIRSLNPPPEKMAALKELLIERDHTERDARAAAKKADVNPNDAAAGETAKIDARIRTLLGETDYAKYAELTGIDYYQRMLESTPLPGSLFDAGVALTPEQRNWIGQLCYRTLGPASPAVGDEASARYIAFRDALLTQSPGNLTSAQIAALRAYFAKEDERTAQMNALLRARPPK